MPEMRCLKAYATCRQRDTRKALVFGVRQEVISNTGIDGRQ